MSLVRNALLVLASLVLSLLAIEAVLRTFPGMIPLGSLVEFDPNLRSSIAKRRNLQRASDTVLLPRDDGGPPDRLWIYRPGATITRDFDEVGIVRTVRMDDQGFCNPTSDSYESPRFDVIATGDSFTWCTSVRPEDAWPAVFARATGLSTYNLGMPGRGPQEYLEILKKFGVEKHPRYVILDIYEGNDFRDSYRFHQWKTGDDEASIETPCPFSSSRVCNARDRLAETALGRHSYAYNLVAGGLWHMASEAREHAYNFQYDVELPNGTTMPFNTRNGDLNELEYARRLAAGAADLSVFDDAMEGLAALADSAGFRVVVAYTPAAYTAYGDRVRFQAQGVGDTMRAYSERQREYFGRRSAELGFEFVDLTAVLGHEAGRPGSNVPLYFRTNSHLTVRGHEVVALTLARNSLFAGAIEAHTATGG